MGSIKKQNCYKENSWLQSKKKKKKKEKAWRTQFPSGAPDGHSDKQIAFHHQFLEHVKNGPRSQYVVRDDS